MEQFYAALAHTRVAKFFLTALVCVTLSLDASANCNNVTNGGTIGSDQSGCYGFDPSALTSVSNPSGGSGALEIIWMYWNASTNWNMTQVSGATGLTYDPGAIFEDTYFRRCSRRAGCSSYDGESNDIFIDITSCVTCSNVTNGGSICCDQTVCYGGDPVNIASSSNPSGGSGSLEIIWMYKSASTGWNLTQVSGATGLSYNPGPVYEDTYFRRCARRAGCTDYVGESNDVFIDVTACCDNVTDGGSICCDQTICYGGDPTLIYSTQDPTGGSGALETIWMYRNASTGWSLTQFSGATGLSFDPGAIYEDTYIRRCARRAGCSSWNGESNEVFIDVNECCTNAITSLVIYDINNGTSTAITNGASYTLSSLPSSWNVEALISGGESVSFNWSGSYNNYNVENYVPFRSPGDNTPLNLGAGTYTLTATVYSQDGASGTACDSESVTFTIVGCDNVTNPGQIGSNQSGCAPFNPAPFTSISLPSGGSGAIEYVWIYRNASTGNVWTTIPNSNSATYDAGPLTQTTEFRRCARRANCSDYVGESNILIVTVTGPCTPDLDCAMTGYDAVNGRIFWIPAYGTDFKSSPGDPLKFLQFSNGTAHMVGTIERISNSNHKFYVSIWFDTKSTFAQWIAMGLSPKSPELGDETTWTFYKFSTQLPNTLTGQGSLAGVNLNVTNQNPIYGLQLGNGANSLNSNANGISAWFSYTGTTSGNGDINGTYECGPLCNLDVNAGPDQEICGPVAITLTSTVTGASNCTTTPVTDCNHTLADAGGWLENSGASAVCGDNAGTKLWTQSGNGTSYITLDLGANLPAGTTICARMKLEHCSNSGTSYSNAKIQASTSSNSGFVNLAASETFSQNSYQLFCYQLDYEARYIKISDNGNCAFRVDYVEYTTTGSDDSDVTYVWSGPGIVGANDGPSVNVNQPGTYTVTVTDCHGCTDSDTVIVTNDDEDPIFDQQQTTYNLNCGESVPVIQPTATDNNGAVTYTYADIVNCNQPNAYCNCTHTRVWTAEDLCDNTATFTQYFVYSDTVDPVLVNVPSNATVNCDNIPGAPVVTATDNCDDQVQVDYSSVNTEGCPYTITRTWVATDNCGNQSTATQVLTVVDLVDPTLVGVPANMVAECSNIPAPAVVSATDNCDTYVPVQFSTNTIAGSGCTYIIERTWTATDDCGNEVSATQIIEVTDTTDPILVGVPASATVECDEIPAVPQVYGDDNCDDNVDVTFNEDVTEGCPYTITRTWTGTDNCYNTVTMVQVITVIDTTYPVLHGVPADMTLECDQTAPEAIVWATDNCDDDMEVALSASTQDLVCGSIFTRTWSVTDDCGNTTTATQVITFVDTTDPVILNAPVDITVECSDDVPAYVPMWSDNCDDTLHLEAASSISFDDCYTFIHQTYTATDDCGNSTTVVRNINIVDTTDPILSGVPADATVECSDIPAPAVPTATDNCDELVDIDYIQVMVPGDECTYYLVRTWTATDECDNSVSQSQTLTVTDTIDPVLTGEDEEFTLECNIQPSIVAPTASDNCDDNVTIVPSMVTIPGACENAWTEVYTWTAYDNCGNTDVRTLTIHFQDTTSPELVGVPVNTTVECDEIPAPAEVTAVDNCDTYVPVEFSQSATEGCPYTITRTWYGVDNCGNPVSATQIIEVIDTTYPVLHGVPADMTLECDQTAPEAVVYATDNCDQNMIVSLDASTEDLVCGSIFTRTWSVTDDCGNTTTATQVITFVDTTDPVILNAPVDITVECSDDVPAYVPMWSDNCDDTLHLEAASSISFDDCYTFIHQTYTATDDCGNSTTVVRNINIVDTTDPILSGVPADATVECSDIPAPAVPTATDNCDELVDIDYIQVMVPGDECTYYLVRTWTATDECDNSVSQSQTLTVTDTIDPVLTGEDEEFTLECNIQPSIVAPTASDNCDDNVTIVPSMITIPGACENAWTEVYTWTAYDNCGNTDVRTLTIHFQDTTDPVLTGEDEEFTLECNIQPSIVAPTASDNCDDNVTIVPSMITVPGACENAWTEVYTWTAYDNCGNTDVRTLTIHFQDTTSPELVGVPVNTTVECDEIPAPAEVTAVDNCDTYVPVEFSQSATEGCPYTITRTWYGVDNCGNLVSATQIIEVIDTTYPVLHGVPADMTLECDQTAPEAVVYATDNCDQNMIVSLDASTEDLVCGSIFTRTWSVTDDCGNTTTATQVITFVDTTDPVILNAPVDITVECSDDVPAYVPMWSDNCDDTLHLEAASSISFDDCYTFIHQTYTATDDCGNSTTVVRNINIVDTTDPILSGVPADATVECSDIPAPAVPTATDNCDELVDIDYIQVMVPGDECTYYLVRTWTATDECDNSVSQSQTLTVTDTIDPVLTGEDEEFTLECNIQPSIVAPTASDNCDDNVTIVPSMITIPGACENAWTEVYTWTAYDNCGNTDVRTLTIHFQDTTSPELVGVPVNTTVECDEIPAPAEVTAVDNCDTYVPVEFSQSATEGCPYTITRTWYGVDNCGNPVSATQIIEVIDTTYPVLHGVPADMTLECDQTAPEAVVYATDNCDQNMIVSLDASTEDLVCGSIFTRTWSVTDDCGNTTTATQVITFVDTTDPVILNAPVDITVECSDDVPAYVPMWSDNCDDTLHLEAASSISFDDCYTFIHQTYTATDDCGNSTTVVRNINIVDTTDPILSGVPADATVECSDIPAPAVPTATDNCDELVDIDYIQVMVPGDECTYYLVRTWTATDECDNSVSQSQTLTVTDTTDPYISNTPPVEYNIECGDVIPVNDPIFADNCDNNLDIDFTEVEVSGACPGGLMRTWIATDNCGNSVSFVQYIFIHDTTAPVISGEDEEYTLECNIQPSIVAPSVYDACDNDVTVDFNLDVIPGDCPNSWTEVYTWTAEDNCENVSVRTITIHYQDTTAPVLSAYPASGVVECDNIPVALIITASDNCDDNVDVDYNQTISEGACEYVITRTWTAEDDCGNDVSHTQVLTVVDTTDPYVTEGVPAELTIECNAQIPVYTPSFDDNCDNDLTVVPTEVEVNFTNCGYDIERSWTATDNCGNSISVYQTIHIVDSIDPVLVGVPANTTVECNAVPGAPLVTATDNCDDNVTVGLVTTETEGCPYTITRTWTATDDCGNVTTASQVITVVDTNDPYVVEGVPAELTIECDEDEPAYLPVFGDNCDSDLTITAISGINNVTPCGYDIERAWTATDNCDNAITVYQVIHVVDTTNPVLIGVPANVTVECDNVPAPASVTVTDNCATDLVAIFSADTTTLECGYIIERTWTAYDYCENPVSASQIVTVVDTTDPIIETVLNDVTIECGEEIPAVPTVVASDNCDNMVEIEYSSAEVALECGYMIVRTWIATDNCGNEDSAEQIVYVIDETAPVIVGIPADITVECDQPIPAPAAATATDNCDGNVTVTTNDQFLPQDCFYQIKRYYTAVDACGNTTSIPQIITVVDTTDPIIEAPADITVNCDEIPAPAELSATDNCDINVEVTYTENEGEGCPYTIERIWTATDDCGNTTTVTQIVTVIDEVYPVFESFPAYVVVECDEVQSYMISATDNCDNQVEISVIQEFPVSGECYGSLLRVYQAEDNCGNITISGTQIVDIVDSTPPTLIGVPADVFITCGEELPAVANVTADDNCAVDLQVQFTQTQTNEFCPYDVIRTWSTIDDCGNVTVMTQTIHVSVEVPGFVQLSAYPNPADQHFTVKFSVASDKDVQGGIYDVTGREVLPIMNGKADGGRLYQWEMDARTLGQGSYMIQMVVDGEVHHQKLIISVK